MARKKYSKKEASNLIGQLAFLQSGGGIFKGMAPIMGTGRRATIIDTNPKMGAGHKPPGGDFALLSDGSKLALTGKNKGLIIK